MARHSDPKLTLNVYSHVSVFNTSKAVEALPDLTEPGLNVEKAAATGADGQPISVPLAHYLPTGGDGQGRKPSETVAMNGPKTSNSESRNFVAMLGLRREQSGRDGFCRKGG